jgi:hypothetical protein
LNTLPALGRAGIKGGTVGTGSSESSKKGSGYFVETVVLTLFL